MGRLANDPKLQTLARELGITARGNVLERLRSFAVGRVEAWHASMPVESAPDLLRLVSSFLSVRLVFLTEETDFDELAVELAAVGGLVRQQLRTEFETGNTLGYLAALQVEHPGDHRYVAIIDARGPLVAKRYFTAWHEVCHLLIHPPQLAFEGFRRVTEFVDTKDPIEVLVDQIAGTLAFYEPIVGPALRDLVGPAEDLTLGRIEEWRDTVAPDASYLAAALAAIRMVERPAAFLSAAEKLKRSEERAVATPQLSIAEFAAQAPAPKLRVAVAAANDAARAGGLTIFPNMRIPSSSIIFDAFESELASSAWADECQSDFEAGGEHLRKVPLKVEAQFRRPVVYALLLPTG